MKGIYMKTLVVYYSRTGVTRKVAELIVKELNCDFEEIVDTKDRSGVKGFMSGGNDATLKKLAIIKNIKVDPKSYDLVIIGTPVWAFTMTPAIRTYITNNKDMLKNVALFCTVGGLGGKKTLREMEDLINKKPVSTLELLTKDMTKGDYAAKIRSFIEELAKYYAV